MLGIALETSRLSNPLSSAVKPCFSHTETARLRDPWDFCGLGVVRYELSAHARLVDRLEVCRTGRTRCKRQTGSLSYVGGSSLGQREGRSGYESGLGHRPSHAQRNRSDRPWRTTARSIIPQRMLALVGWMNSHLVRQHGQVSKETNCRDDRCDDRAPFMPVPL